MVLEEKEIDMGDGGMKEDEVEGRRERDGGERDGGSIVNSV